MFCKCPPEKCLAENFREFLSVAEMAELLKFCGFSQTKKNCQTNFVFKGSVWLSLSTFFMIVPLFIFFHPPTQSTATI